MEFQKGQNQPMMRGPRTLVPSEAVCCLIGKARDATFQGNENVLYLDEGVLHKCLHLSQLTELYRLGIYRHFTVYRLQSGANVGMHLFIWKIIQ